MDSKVSRADTVRIAGVTCCSSGTFAVIMRGPVCRHRPWMSNGRALRITNNDVFADWGTVEKVAQALQQPFGAANMASTKTKT